jgi:hypothetical protein
VSLVDDVNRFKAKMKYILDGKLEKDVEIMKNYMLNKNYSKEHIEKVTYWLRSNMKGCR